MAMRVVRRSSNAAMEPRDVALFAARPDRHDPAEHKDCSVRRCLLLYGLLLI
jgi:hypothetical protein